MQRVVGRSMDVLIGNFGDLEWSNLSRRRSLAAPINSSRWPPYRHVMSVLKAQEAPDQALKLVLVVGFPTLIPKAWHVQDPLV